MIYREEQERREYDILAPEAQKSIESRGRRLEEAHCPLRTVYQRDRDRILHSKAFRRLKHKTQVFLSPEGDHYRTRLTHTLEVAQISRTIARILRLNEDLTEAIALGHDLGHTPFGHCGESKLNAIHPGGFRHNVQSLRVVDYLERRNGSDYGLNLTAEVRDGIVHHSGEGIPYTLEGQLVKLCDRIAYLNHDIDDAVRAGVLKADDLPDVIQEAIGRSHGERINTLICNVVSTSTDLKSIRFSDDMREIFDVFRAFMFDRVYYNPEAKGEESKAEYIIESLYVHYNAHPEQMPPNRYEDYKREGAEAVKDYVAGMSDRYAVGAYRQVFIPTFWRY